MTDKKNISDQVLLLDNGVPKKHSNSSKTADASVGEASGDSSFVVDDGRWPGGAPPTDPALH
jgi:hypothetical protein